MSSAARLRLSVVTIVVCGAGLLAPALWFGDGTGLPAQDSGVDSDGQEIARAAASLQPAQRTDVKNQVGWTLPLRFIAPEGKRVEKGTLVAELDATPVEGKLAEGRVKLAQTEARFVEAEATFEADLREAEAMGEVAELGLEASRLALNAFVGEGGEYGLELLNIETEIGTLELQLKVSASRADGLKGLAEVEQAPRFEYEEATTAVAQTELQLRAAKERRRFLTEHVQKQRQAELRLSVAQHELELVRARNKIESLKRTFQAKRAALGAERESDRANLGHLEERIEGCKIRAPHDGVVLYPAAGPRGRMPARAARAPRALQPGASVRDGQVLLQIVDMKRFHLVATVPLDVAQRSATGQGVAVRVDALPEIVFAGHIVRQKVISERGREATKAEITVAVEDSEGRLRPGMTGEVALKLAPRDR